MAIDRPALGKIIASREYTVAMAGGTTETAEVCIGQPVESPEGEYWQCPYEIKCSSFARRFYSAGEDSMQALILATHMLAVEIELLAKKHNAKFLLHGVTRLALPDIEDVRKM